jgi:hypothetical protein
MIGNYYFNSLTISKPVIIYGGVPHITVVLSGPILFHLTEKDHTPVLGKPQAFVTNVITNDKVVVCASRVCFENVGMQGPIWVTENGDLDIAMANVNEEHKLALTPSGEESKILAILWHSLKLCMSTYVFA